MIGAMPFMYTMDPFGVMFSVVPVRPATYASAARIHLLVWVLLVAGRGAINACCVYVNECYVGAMVDKPTGAIAPRRRSRRGLAALTSARRRTQRSPIAQEPAWRRAWGSYIVFIPRRSGGHPPNPQAEVGAGSTPCLLRTLPC